MKAPRKFTPRRMAKFKRVSRNRQLDLAVVLENIHDPHNIGAILRSCDSVGIPAVHIINTDETIPPLNIRAGKRASSSARKWVDTYYYTDVSECMELIKKNFINIVGTKVGEESVSLFELDLTQPTAIILGNEHRGISEEALAYCTGNFRIPQMGMVESLNVSVACAVTLYETLRQREAKGMYGKGNNMPNEDYESILNKYISRNEKRV